MIKKLINLLKYIEFKKIIIYIINVIEEISTIKKCI